MSSDGFKLPRTLHLKDGLTCVVDYVRESDARDLLDFLPQTHRESDFLGYMQGEFNLTLDQEKDFIRSQAGSANCVLIAARIAGRLVATAGAIGSKLRRSAHQTELGISVSRDVWGKGLGRQLMDMLLEWAMDRRFRKVTLRVFEDNVRGIALYQSLGFIEEGLLRGDALRADGSYTNTIVMAKLLVAQ